MPPPWGTYKDESNIYSETRKAKSEKIGNIFNLHDGLHCCHLNAASIQAKDWKFKQGCALAAPGDLWHLTFALRRLENLHCCIQIMCWAPWILQFQSTNLHSIFLRAQPCLSVLYCKMKNLLNQKLV